MCSELNLAPKNMGADLCKTERSKLDSIIRYTLPEFRKNKGGSYIEFYAFDPIKGRLRRKRIKTNRVKGKNLPRHYIHELMKRLTEQLMLGWNPWIAQEADDLATIEEALNRFENHIEKMISSGYFRKETYAGYKSFLKILRIFISEKKPIHYAYQFDRRFCVDFLDYVFIDRENGAQTRNNYLNSLRVLSGFMVEKGYLTSKPTEGIAPINKRLFSKERTCIPLDVISKIADYCKDHDRPFLLACYMLYYAFIRPVEMTRLRIRDFDLKAGTVTIPAHCSKNHKEQTVTLPKKVIHYAIEIGTFSAPMSDFIFSYQLKPGRDEIDPKHFRDHWEKLRKALNLRKEWKFYSLKDTGITAMLKNKMAAIAVRDQARHSSLAITEIYTDHRKDANPEILNLDGAL